MLAGSADGRPDDARDRLLAGVVDAVGGEGYRAVAVADVLRVSGCARRTFYTHFANLEAAMLAAHDAAARHASELATDAWVGGSADGLGDGLEAVLERIVRLTRDEPLLARFLVVEAPVAGGPAVWRQQDRFVDRLAAFVRPLLARAGRESSLLPEIFAGAVVATLRRRLAAGDHDGVERLPRDAMGLLARFSTAGAGVAVAA